ncbi:MAG: peptidoglycan-binding protein [Ruminococcus sp.]|nr:peptidoglycan-binding protein [Ruminococcus sp.]
MKKFKKIISIIMIAAVIASIVVVGTVSSSASGTGVGLAEWALNAYYSKWSYVYGGATPGTVDCSGLIYSYAGGYRVGDAQTFNSDWRYSLNGSIPNIHGLGLYKPGHVGVYVGDGMAVDARGSQYGVCYESVWSHGWTQYFKVPGVSYPDTGWVEFDGDYYYYEDGEYLADTTRTIDGETYVFASSGKSTSSPSSSSSSSVSSSSSSKSDSDSDTGSLKKGSNGSRVEKLQQRLLDLGYYNGSVDGDFGDATETAFKLFQEKMGLYVDGVAGSDADYLFAEDAPAYKKAETEEEKPASDKEELADTGVNTEAEEAPAMSYTTGDYSDDIYKIQERLIALGYMTGEADGEFGEMTAVAVKNFQTANGLEATGIVEQATYDKLFADSAVAAKAEEEKPAEEKTANADAVSPAVAGAAINNEEAPKSSSAPKTEVEKNNSELSGKGVAALTTENSIFKRGANATNFEFLIWLAVMIVVLLIAFSIVYAVEKKKQRAAYHARRFQ